MTDDVISAFDYYYGQGAYDSLYGTGKLTSGGSSGGGSTGKKKGSYSNGSLTNQQVKQLQKYYGVSQDGKWGANSKKAAGGLTADEAWAKYQGGGRTATKTNSAGVTATGSNYATIAKNSAAGAYGPKYGATLNMIQAQFGRGANASTLSDIISAALKRGDINEAGASTIMQTFGY